MASNATTPTDTAATPPWPAGVYELDDYDLDGFLRVARDLDGSSYGYVVTPNADHIIRLHEDPAFRALYAAARYVLLDSRLAARLLRLFQGLRLRVCTGSDLTAALFERVIRPSDRLIVIGAQPEQVAMLRARHGLTNLVHHNPPMGFIKDPAAVGECLSFVEAHSPFRYCFVAVGSPQQEIVAHALGRRGQARGLTLCVGASIDFLTGVEVRAPLWMQRLSLEWLFRLLQNPRRLFRRYLVRGPRVIGCLRHARIIVRAPA